MTPAPLNSHSVSPPPGPYRAVTDGALSRRAVSATCPVCGAMPGNRCEVDPDARPYPSTMRVGVADPFHIVRPDYA